MVARTPESACDATRNVATASAAMSGAPSAHAGASGDAHARMRSRSCATFGLIARAASSFAVDALAPTHARRMSPGEWCAMRASRARRVRACDDGASVCDAVATSSARVAPSSSKSLFETKNEMRRRGVEGWMRC